MSIASEPCPETFSRESPEFIPARTLCEYAFCPRAGYIEWVQSDNADNLLTLDGTFKHRRVHAKREELPSDEDFDDSAPRIIRSLLLSSRRLGLISRIDLVELVGNSAVPVEYKRSRRPNNPEGAWEPVRVQLCAQGLLLRDNGYTCDQGYVYYVDSKERVRISLDEPLIERTLALSIQFRMAAESSEMPPPLEDSSKCSGCSLSPICLPDEIGLLKTRVAPAGRFEPRRLIPARDDAMPVYVQAQGGYVSKKGDILIVKENGKKVAEAKLFETSQLVIMGNAQVTTQTIQELMRRGIPVIYMSSGGWFYGMATGPMNRNVDLRIHQYEAVRDPGAALRLSRQFIAAKIRNCRTLLRRNARADLSTELEGLKESAKRAAAAEDQVTLLGIEGNAARIYFSRFESMIKQASMENGFAFQSRNRRPPKDPVNALLSLAYSLLAKDITVLCAAAGLDPYLGLYHKPRYGRPSLALDLMEEFRPLIADSATLNAINNGVVSSKDFLYGTIGVNLKPGARRKFILTYERRMDQLIRHPLFGYQISYRRVLDVQVRLLGRFLAGELPEYPAFLTR